MGGSIAVEVCLMHGPIQGCRSQFVSEAFSDKPYKVEPQTVLNGSTFSPEMALNSAKEKFWGDKARMGPGCTRYPSLLAFKLGVMTRDASSEIVWRLFLL